VEQERATGLGKRQIPEFVEDDEVDPCQGIGQAAGVPKDRGLSLIFKAASTLSESRVEDAPGRTRLDPAGR
jgi:hypothetical protein